MCTNKNYIGAALLLFILISFTASAKNALKFERLSLDEGAALNLTYCMLQDHKGFIWFGTMYGLVKYDGRDYFIYKNNPYDSSSISFDDIISLYEDTKHNIWIGTWGGGLNCFNPETGKFKRYINNGNKKGEISGNIIWTICEDDNHNMWFGTETGGLDKLIPGSNTFKIYRYLNNNAKNIPVNSVRCIYKSKDGNLWIGNADGLSVYNKRTDDFINYSIKSFEKSLSVNTIYEDKRNNLLIGTSEGLFIFDRNVKKFKSAELPDLHNEFIHSICGAEGNILWIGTINGLYKVDSNNGNIYHFFNVTVDPTSLSGNNIINLFTDKSGIIWINAYGTGINKLDKNISPFISNSPMGEDITNPSNNSVNAFCTTDQNNIWLGTPGGLFCYDKKMESFRNYSSGKAEIITSLYPDKNHIWIGTANGLRLFNSVTMKYETLPSPLKDNKLLKTFRLPALLKDKLKLYIGTYGRGLYVFDQKTNYLKNYNAKDWDEDNHANYVLCFCQDNLNPEIIWIGTYGGLIRMNINQGSFKVFRHKLNDQMSLSNDYVFSIKRDSRNILWIGTANGLNKMNEKTNDFIHYYEKDGLPSSVISSIVEDDEGNLWISTNYGVSNFNPEKDKFTNYDMKDGLRNNLYLNYSYLKDAEGNIYFGGINGFDIIQPSLLNQSDYVPGIYITSVKKMNSEGKQTDIPPFNKEIELAYNENFIKLKFVSLDYTNPSENLYKYMLPGIDNDWIFSGNINTAVYTNLSPGDYTFYVKGSNSSGVFNPEAASLRITILPPFWKTTWFIISVTAISALIIYLFYRLRIRQKINHAIELEKIRQEEGEKIRKKTAADFHDELGHRLTRISLLSEIIKREIGTSSQELTTLLNKISSNSYELYEGTKDFIWAIDPQKDSLYELLVRLKDFGDDLFEDSDISFEVKGIEEPELKDKILTMDWKRHLALIFKEGMNNSLKHGSSRKITIESKLNDDNVEIILSDNGIGFIPDSAARGNGIKNMKKRAQKLSADLEVISAPGIGTKIYFRGKIPEQEMLCN
ncbi:MAG TPA: two-component regulator propeller domain-containing protein [Ignavibacteriaceae bacterium]|nr:two-component regulator propeller domain-containing protein [Ignavibacteriaceae bacterium]